MSWPVRFFFLPGCPVGINNSTLYGRCGERLSLNEWDQPTCPVHGVVAMGLISKDDP